MNNDLEDFEQFLKEREQASQAYVNGDAEPLLRICARDLPATFFSPNGDYLKGAQQVVSSYESGAKHFDSSSDNRFETLQMAASGGIAYWVGLQRSASRLKGKSEVVPISLRVTEIFRREASEWKMVHRHADFLKSEPEGDKK